MEFSVSTKKELIAERDRLLARVRAIQSLLGAEGEPKHSEPMLTLPIGIRDGIRAALTALNEGRPRDVTKHLQAIGFSAEGETPLALRVSNEMWRMAEAGELVRNGRLYRLK